MSKSKSNINIDAVLESLSNYSCNSITATYYLLQQKHRINKELINNNYIVQNKILERKNKNYLLDKFNHHEVILNNDIVQNVNENKNKNKIENNQKNDLRKITIPIICDIDDEDDNNQNINKYVNQDNNNNNNNNDDFLNEKVVIYKGHLVAECIKTKDDDNNNNYYDNNIIDNDNNEINNNNVINNNNSNNNNNIYKNNETNNDNRTITSPHPSRLFMSPAPPTHQPPPSSSSFSASKGLRPRGGSTTKRTFIK